MEQVVEIQGLVLGGGPSGLSVAYGLGDNTLVLEREPVVGGLCRSLKHEGGVFDIGGHSFHTPHPEVYALVQKLLDGKLVNQRREARVYVHGSLISYPFQKSFYELTDRAVVKSCEDGMAARLGGAAESANYEEYIIRQFGDGIAEHFMLPYNRKLWARDLKQMSSEWTSQRVAAPIGQDETFEHGSGERKPLQADTEVGYPETGGFDEIFKALATNGPGVHLNTQVVRIDPVSRIAESALGQHYQYEYLVSTLPLPSLVRSIEGVPEEIVDMADALEYVSLRIELLTTRRPLDTPVQRIYAASPEIPPHKIALNHNSSDSLRALPNHAIMAEVAYSEQKTIETKDIAPRTIELLCELDILSSPEDVSWQGHIDLKYGYPVYTNERASLVQGIKDWLEPRDIYTLGRFGEWEYINSDACIMKGLDLALELRERYPRASQDTGITTGLDATGLNL